MKRIILLLSCITFGFSSVNAQTWALYGTSVFGGTSNMGTVFSYTVGASKDTVLASFNGTNGSYPYSNLVYDNANGLYYGTTNAGGDSDKGVLFSYSPYTGQTTKIISFHGLNGSSPLQGSITLYNNILYGTTEFGGIYDLGVLYSYDPSTSTYTTLINFSDQNSGPYQPYGSTFTYSNGLLYGMSYYGGVHNNGTIYSFDPATGKDSVIVSLTSATGENPNEGILTYCPKDGLLYGMTYYGGTGNFGTIFKFDPATGSDVTVFNFDSAHGITPSGSLVYDTVNSLFYGMTYYGGSNKEGTLFSFDPVSTTYTVLENFTNTGSNYYNPSGDLVVGPNNILYGLMQTGGSHLQGVIFAYDIATATDSTVYSFDVTHGAEPYGSLTLKNQCSYTAFTKQPSPALICNGSDTSFTATAQSPASLTYQWQVNTGSGFTNVIDGGVYSGSTTTTLHITGAPAGMNGYKYIAVAIGGSCGNITSDTVTLTVDSALIGITALPANATVCQGDTVTLSGSGGTSYSWTGSITDGVAFVPGASAKYVVTGTDVNGCSNKDSVSVVVNTLPTVSVTSTANTVCAGITDTITATPSGNNPFTFNWSNGSTTDTTMVDSGGTYSVTVTDVNGCKSIDSSKLVVNPLPTVSITTSSHGVCPGIADTLTENASGNSPFTYNWSNGSTSDTAVVSAAAQYSVTVTDANNCKATDTVTVNVNTLPTVSISASASTVCAGTPDTITESPSGNGPFTYNWSNGSTNDTAMVAAGGTYSVTVTDANGCTATDNTSVTVNPLPTVSHSFSAGSACSGKDTLIESPSGNGPFTYNWSNGATTDSIIISTGGPYSVTVTDANGCMSVDTTTVTATSRPTAAMTTTTGAICGGAPDTLIENVISGKGPFTYNWSTGYTGDTIIVSTGGTYSVTVTDVNGCTAIDSAQLSATPLPGVSITVSASVVCAGTPDTLTENATGNGPFTYTWSNGSTSDTAMAAASGTYSVTVTDVNRCKAIDSSSITVNPLPVINITASSNAVCAGITDTLIETASGNAPFTYNWSNGGTTDTITVTTGGTYSVTVTDANNCTATDTAAITVNALPVVSMNASTSAICAGAADTLIENVTGNAPFTYNWSTGDTNDSLIVASGGTYSITVTDVNGCKATDSTQLSSVSLPVATITASSSGVCAGMTDTLTASATGNAPFSYSWSNGSTANPDIVTAGGTYKVVVTDANGCKSVDTTHIRVSPWPTITISGTDSIIAGTTDTLTASGGATYVWTSGSTSDTTMVAPSSTTTYTVTGTDTNGCSVNASFTVVVTVASSVPVVASTTASTSLYPNPATEALNLSFTGNTNGMAAVVKIITASGKEVMTGNTTINTGKALQFNISGLAQGLYFVKIITGKSVQVIQFVKQ